MIGLEVVIQIHPSMRREFLQSVEWLSNECKLNNDCIGYDIFECVNTANRFLWIEQWNDMDSLKRYLKSDHFNVFLGAIQTLGNKESLREVEFKIH